MSEGRSSRNCSTPAPPPSTLPQSSGRRSAVPSGGDGRRSDTALDAGRKRWSIQRTPMAFHAAVTQPEGDEETPRACSRVDQDGFVVQSLRRWQYRRDGQKPTKRAQFTLDQL